MFGTIFNADVCWFLDSLSSHRPKTSALLRKTISSEATEMLIFIYIYRYLYICEEMCGFFVLKCVMSGSCSILILFNQ